jgi:plastocyanin domain-containing protein
MMTRTLVLPAVLLGIGCHAATSQGGAMLAAPHERSARRIPITAGKHGFEPARIAVTSGETVTLVFTRITERTCAKDVIVHLSERDTAKRELPLNEPVELTVTFTRAGEIGYACSMQMLGGAIEIK